MSWDSVFVLWMQQDAAATATSAAGDWNRSMIVVAVIAAIVLPFLFGNWLTAQLRVPDLGKRFGVMLSVLTLAGLVVSTRSPKLGVDLRGGSNLIYEVDLAATRAEQQTPADGQAPPDAGTATGNANGQGLGAAEMAGLIDALSRRVNPTGVREIVLRPYGTHRIEVIVPEVSAAELEQIKQQIVSAGLLKFRILADQRKHAALAQLANSPENAGQRFVRDATGKIAGEWLRVARERSGNAKELGPLKMIPPESALTREPKDGVVEVLVVEPDEAQNILGDDLGPVRRGLDENGAPCINFTLNTKGAQKMGLLTQMNLPDAQAGRYSYLAIVMDNEIESAPRIQSRINDSGQITGRFTEAEVDSTVQILNAGRLPAVLKKTPISENRISSLLGEDTKRQGTRAIYLGGVAVLLFMLWFYKFAGLIACLALAANLLLTVALAIQINAAFTLPGLAGLVLTIGMSVDANVLIYERMREEMAKGAGLRTAIRNGFSRASTTIIDAQLTSLITGFVLYAIGTDALRGFATLLILGIATSLFTAITCSRVVFELLERTGQLKKLNFVKLFDMTNIDFIKYRNPAIIGSLVFIGVGLVAAWQRGRTLFDIDFSGGSSVLVALNKEVPIDQVRSMVNNLAPSVSVFEVDVAGRNKGTAFRIDCSLDDVDKLRTGLQERLVENGQTLLQMHSMKFDSPTAATIPATPALSAPQGTSTGTPAGSTSTPAGSTSTAAPSNTTPSSTTAPAPTSGTAPSTAPAAESTTAPPADVQTAPATESAPAANSPAANPPAEGTSTPAAPADAQPAAEAPVEPAPPSPTTEGTSSSVDRPRGIWLAQATDAAQAVQELLKQGAAATPAATTIGSTSASSTSAAAFPRLQSTLKFDEPINAETLRRAFSETATAQGIAVPGDVTLVNPDWDGSEAQAFQEWTAILPLAQADAEKLLTAVSAKMASQPVWLSSNTFGGAVAGNMQKTALKAIIISLLGIIAYVWFRFHRVTWGLAGVIALIHDGLCMVAAVALSTWLAPFLGFALVEDFRISLAVVAAILTILGYSINDTIVIFDRIREVRGRNPEVTAQMINTSLNQTLSRTILTAFTTLLTVIVLYIWGGPGIHAFAFVLLIGIVVGTYSTVYIAAPILLWLRRADEMPQTSQSGSNRTKTMV